MVEIRFHQHPFAAEPPQRFLAQSLPEWLLARYERRPAVGIGIYAGEPSLASELTSVEAIMRAEAPYFTVLETPGDPGTIGYTIGQALISAAVSMAISYALSFFLAPDPNDSVLGNRSQESANNQLANRENRVRPLERVEDIYGTERAFPSLLMPTYNKYISHKKVEYGYYCIGRGYYDVEDVREGDTALTGITGASAAIYAPFTSPNSGTPQATIGDAITDTIKSVVRSSAVDRITLKAQNQIQLESSLLYRFYGPGSGDVSVPASSGDIIYQPAGQRRPNFAAIAEPGQTLTISMANTSTEREDATGTLSVDGPTKTYTSTKPGFFRGVVPGTSVTISGAFVDPANTGTKTVVSNTNQTLTVAEALVTESGVGSASFVVMVNYSGVRTITTVESGYVFLSGTPQISPEDYPMTLGTSSSSSIPATMTVDNGLTDWTDWYTLPDADRTEVWANVLAAGGMYKDNGEKQATGVFFTMEVEQLDSSLNPTGTVESVSSSIGGATANERADTVEHTTAWTGPARVRMRRTTSFDYTFSGVVQDEITWVDLYSVSPVTKLHFGNKTTIHTVTKSTIDSTAIRRRELNCLASRKLPTYNGTTFSGTFDSTGALATGTISATSKIADIIAAVCVDPKIGNRDIDDDVDMAQIWATQQTLDAWDTECGQFNFTFDSDSTSFEETVQIIADAAFCTPYRQNGKIRLALDRPQSSSVALFTHRNKKPKAETITRKFASDAEYDGVELVYMDPETEKQETIRLPLDGSYTKLKRVEVPGIRSYEQAWFRANREYRRLIGQRISIETEVTAEARALLPNSRVDIVDNTRFKSFDGEVVGQSGLTLTLSRDVEFIPATAHSIILTQRDGTPESIACTEVVGSPNKVLLASPPSETVVTTPTNEDGIRTTFSFAADSARAAMAYLVREIGTSDGQYVRLRAVNYSADYYAADSLAIPSKSTVIN